MPDDDRVIQFPGVGKRPGKAGKAAKDTPAPDADPVAIPDQPTDLSHLSADQQKAISIILSGMSFVLVGIKPTPSGADFFTALHGEGADLRNAEAHLPGVIERALARRGV